MSGISGLEAAHRDGDRASGRGATAARVQWRGDVRSAGRRKEIEASLEEFVRAPRFGERGGDAAEAWPCITIVTPSLNQAQYLEQTILSVLNQNYPNLRYIVLDGGSTDGSVAIIKKYEKYLSYWLSERDGGQAAALARGFSLAENGILAWLNSDDLYLPGTLSRIGSFFRDNRNAEFVYGDCLVIDSCNRVIRQVVPVDFRRDIFLYENSIIPQPAAFWRLELYRRVGGLDPRFAYCMDYDLWARFELTGVAFIRLDACLAGIRLHPDSKSSRLQAVRQREHREITERVLGRRLGLADELKARWLRLKRYYLSPRALGEACLSRASRWRLGQ